ncbi:hypothetical protein ACFODZ_07215 [Marinicella sediminis]|uniref:DUF1902 domain-containing protein n=1 Tax=Marinicella sediminis TaxID=1792834 RepID=A0ABV7J7E4_9GAMM|nr:hypothetical protein [Marinicella sediminis]
MADQWELYNLEIDGNEERNLLVYDAEFPTIIDAELLPDQLNMETAEIKLLARKLRAELASLEADCLSLYPAAHPTAGHLD